MTVATETCSAERAWTGVETSFNLGFPCDRVEDLLVSYQPAVGSAVPLTRGLHYTVALDPTTSIATVTPVALPAAPGTLLFERQTPALQAVDFTNLGKYNPDVHERIADLGAMRDQELRRLAGEIEDGNDNPAANLVFDTYAAMFAYTPGAKTVAYRRGYLQVGDGGQGFFIYDPTAVNTHDGGIVVAPASGVGRWILALQGAYSGWVYANQYGAVALASDADRTDAINRAIAAVREVRLIGNQVYQVTHRDGFGGCVQIYKSDRRLVFEAGAQIKLANGSFVSLQPRCPIRIAGTSVGVRISNVEIFDANVDANWTNQGTVDSNANNNYNAIVCVYADRVRLIRPRVINCCHDGISAGACDDLTIDHPQVLNTGKNCLYIADYCSRAIVLHPYCANPNGDFGHGHYFTGHDYAGISISGADATVIGGEVTSSGGIGQGVTIIFTGAPPQDAVRTVVMGTRVVNTYDGFYVGGSTSSPAIRKDVMLSGVQVKDVTNNGVTVVGTIGGRIDAHVDGAGASGCLLNAKNTGLALSGVFENCTINGVTCVGSRDVAIGPITVRSAVNAIAFLQDGALGVASNVNVIIGPIVASGLSGARIAGATSFASGVMRLKESVAGPMTYYVTDAGNDTTGDGLSSATAFATLQRAVDMAAMRDTSFGDILIDSSGKALTSSVVTLKGFSGGGLITLRGDLNNPANCKITVASNFGILADGCIGRWRVEGFQVKTTTAGYGIAAFRGATLTLGLMNTDAVPNAYAKIYAADGGVINQVFDHNDLGNAGYHYLVETGGTINSTGCANAVISGTPAYAQAYVYCIGGTHKAFNMSFSGACTGKRYQVEGNGFIWTNGGDTYFPGNAAGTRASGGMYDVQPAFRAHKNSVDQTAITSGVQTAITFSTEAFDIGGFFAADAWTPPAGRILIRAMVLVSAAVVDQATYTIDLFKDGASICSKVVHASGTSNISVDAAVEDDANGANVYTVKFTGNGAGNKTISGAIFATNFSGHMI